MGKRTKKDVEEAYQRGFRDGYHEAMLHSFRAAVMTAWRTRQTRRLNERISRLVERLGSD